MTRNRILLSLCHMGGTEREWVEKAFETGWITPLGPNVDEFEHRLERYLDAPAVVALSAGTAAIHLGLVMCGVGKGDEVICQSLTFSASANPIVYQGATPVFVDSEPDTWNMDPAALERAVADRLKITGRLPRAIVVVHLYGMPAKMDEILAVARRYGIPVVEDAAEALGSTYRGRHCGTLGEFGTLSFNGNKIITTSGGGALVCPDRAKADRVKFYATQAREPRPYYYHEHIGFNYRMSNLCAGVGCGQMDVLDSHLARRRRIHQLYTEAFAGDPRIKVHTNPSDDFDSNYWLTTITFADGSGIDPEAVRQAMDAADIETRLIWRPMHRMPVFADAPFYHTGVGDDIFARGLCLPSGSILTDSDIDRVVATLKTAIAH